MNNRAHRRKKVGLCLLLCCVGLVSACSSPNVRNEEPSQPRMFAAIEQLRQARKELEMAAPNKDGHRVAAIRFTNRAIEEVQKGIEVGEREH